MSAVAFLGTFSVGPGNAARCAGIGSVGRECVAYLFQNANRLFDRDDLIDRFWTSDAAASSRAALNSTTSRLRRCLKQPSLLQRVFLKSDKWSLGVFFDDPDLTDTGRLEEIYRTLRAGEGDVGTLSDELARLYRGDFLPGHSNRWTLIERERMLSLYVRSVLITTDRFFRKGAHREAADSCREILKHDPLRESVHRRLMLLHALNGEGGRLRRHFRRFEQFLRLECSASPTRRTQELFGALCKDPLLADLESLLEQEVGTHSLSG